MQNDYKLGIVIPCYNEEGRCKLQLFRSHIRDSSEYIFCFVNDGSSDKTLEILKSFQQQFPEKVVVCSNTINQGKAEAVRVGFNVLLTHTLSYIGFLDADLSAPLSEMERLLSIISDEKELSMVFGSRIISSNSCIKRTRFRQWGAGIFAVLARQILRIHIHDTQCGLKIFKTDLAALVFKDAFYTRWLFDIEIFARVKSVYGPYLLSKKTREIPLHFWNEIEDSKIVLYDYIKMPFQFLYLVLHINSGFFKRRFQENYIQKPAHFNKI
ncbi:glycosyltransferase [Chitinophaga silvatica]|uniref:Glycosyltransferase n=1 Tax=Chitinophaga silvatica TaxID=2282649 RepID=A0A3E1Y437_9BACT|nr:glycosyltransferase [Chitinophaga silvatica]RFS19423.1 glycosyltransferase [Chitinophaga silvatica]